MSAFSAATKYGEFLRFMVSNLDGVDQTFTFWSPPCSVEHFKPPSSSSSSSSSIVSASQPSQHAPTEVQILVAHVWAKFTVSGTWSAPLGNGFRSWEFSYCQQYFAWVGTSEDFKSGGGTIFKVPQVETAGQDGSTIELVAYRDKPDHWKLGQRMPITTSAAFSPVAWGRKPSSLYLHIPDRAWEELEGKDYFVGIAVFEPISRVQDELRGDWARRESSDKGRICPIVTVPARAGYFRFTPEGYCCIGTGEPTTTAPTSRSWAESCFASGHAFDPAAPWHSSVNNEVSPSAVALGFDEFDTTSQGAKIDWEGPNTPIQNPRALPVPPAIFGEGQALLDAFGPVIEDEDGA
ncbi:hypothetical protein MKZ38_008842 [Zalerion maritima]|uniref:Uncharacterized protein n=1 Tax=Zalerion maritima TaxID=339359 RepID=A0AAD5S273_9PEZI|nr:hypothetical protein MKZ38_008842 [Zalerion maritima]